MQHPTKLSLVIQSHLSDAAIECAANPSMAKTRIMFVKTLLHKYPIQSIDIYPEQEWDLFCNESSLSKG